MTQKLKFYTLRTLQIIWVSPVAVVVWLFYVFPIWLIFKDLEFMGWAEYGIAEFRLVEKDVEPWHAMAWSDWCGWGGPCVFICKREGYPGCSAWPQTRLHEAEHCRQWLRWGIFHWPAYLLASLWIYLFRKDEHPYLDNPFERQARRAAGQRVDIPREWWEGDRWPWW